MDYLRIILILLLFVMVSAIILVNSLIALQEIKNNRKKKRRNKYKHLCSKNHNKNTRKIKESYLQWLDDNWDEDNLFPPELEPQKAISFLVDYLLGEDWYFVDPVNCKQGNVYILNSILRKYSRRFRKEVKKSNKNSK